MITNSRSIELTQRFDKLYPAGHSNFRIRWDTTDHKVFMDRASGCRVWDVDGNEYVDFMCGYGPTLLGHNHPRYVAALTEHIATSATTYGSSILFTEDDIAVAEKLVRHIPCAEAVKFHITGSEAVQMAVRLARAHTGKDKIVRFEHHYHGWFDNVLGGMLNPDRTGEPNVFQRSDTDPLSDPEFTLGKTPYWTQDSYMLPWNDFEALEACFANYHQNIALIHFEGIVFNHCGLYPKPGFLERIRELCDQHNVVMSMDEIITGFRVGLGGAQGLLGVTPDIATFGKSIGGGLPVSCLVGRADLFEVMKGNITLGPGTFNGYALSVKAVKTTLEILEEDDGAAYRRLSALTERLADGAASIAQDCAAPMAVTSATGALCFVFGVPGGRARLHTEADVAGFSAASAKRFQREMEQRGVIMMANGRSYLSLAHTEDDIDFFLEKMRAVLSGW
ncbi:MAG: aminotransferase class III-fold pyridoxal phosphate-dependent enzyme [Bifidobacteriaceae bacterium]|jgi:glutamate-1-semialdehyde 2,1-aminomutase|nr:aminotransferase class III-fold pyridoxal phosphate-dependent enzyme [Bifidobacteriaceae bacterium]